MTFLIRSNAVRSVKMVDQAFCENLGAGADRSVIGREGKSVSRIHVYSIKDKSLPLSYTPTPMMKSV